MAIEVASRRCDQQSNIDKSSCGGRDNRSREWRWSTSWHLIHSQTNALWNWDLKQWQFYTSQPMMIGITSMTIYFHVSLVYGCNTNESEDCCGSMLLDLVFAQMYFSCGGLQESLQDFLQNKWTWNKHSLIKGGILGLLAELTILFSFFFLFFFLQRCFTKYYSSVE